MLNKQVLKAGLQALFTEMRTKEDISDDYLAEKMADAIEAFVKTGTVTVEPGIAVSTAGSAAAQSGATTSTGTGTIS